MSNYAISLKRTSLLLAALAFTAALLVANLSIFGAQADAAQLTVRSLSLTSSLEGDVGAATAANNETNGADASHTITFDPATGGTIESLRFDFCTTAINACTGPTGLVVNSGTAITTQTNEGVTFTNAYAIDGTSDANTLNVDNATGNSFTAGTGGTIVFTFDDITNPTDVGTFFVRITTYTNDDYTGAVDTGTVASAITTGITITSKVVETLGFSTTADDAGDPAEGSTCAALTGSGALTLGDVTEGTLSISQAYDEFSAFRLYTNAANGVVVQYEGSTLTKGADNINAAGAGQVASTVGSEQFGLAVDADGGIFTEDNEGFGGAGQLTLGANYNGGEGTITNGGTALFAFVADTKTTMATSTSNAYVDCDTAAVRYIGNISPLTPAGTYTTTIVYFAVPTY
jgi:hypothetical protein